MDLNVQFLYERDCAYWQEQQEIENCQFPEGPRVLQNMLPFAIDKHAVNKPETCHTSLVMYLPLCAGQRSRIALNCIAASTF